MTEVYEHNPGDHDDPVAGPTWLVGVLGALVLVATLLGLTALYYNVKARMFTEQVVDKPVTAVQQLREQQRELLEGEPHWVERRAGDEVVRELVIPIDRAIELIATESGGGSP